MIMIIMGISIMKKQKMIIDKDNPVRKEILPIYQLKIDENEISAVLKVLQSGQISRGHLREKFESHFCEFTGSKFAIILNSGTAALHLTLKALNLKSDHEIIIPSLSFVATAFAVEYCDLKPVFVEINPYTFNICIDDVQKKITEKTRAIIAVDFAGLPAELNKLKEICLRYGLYLIEDAAHAIGASYDGSMVGNYSDLTAFSLFATKNMTAGEGGIVTTNNKDWANQIKLIRAHGISPLEKSPKASGFYDVKCLGYNYHLSNLNIALAIEQLKKLNSVNNLRKEKAAYLTKLLEEIEEIQTPVKTKEHVYHLYSIRLVGNKLISMRDQIIKALYLEGIEAGVYYLPIHLHSYFREKYGFCRGALPVTEQVCDSLITLPFYPFITSDDLEDISKALKKVIHHIK